MTVTMAAYKDLCLDAADVRRVGSFWADVLGGELVVRDDGVARIERRDLGVLWINPVPEPKVVKNRVHLDLYAAAPGPLVDRGATLVAGHDGFIVLADPEGNELCLFPDPVGRRRVARPFALCVDSDRPEELARWWQRVLGGRIGPGADGTLRWLHDAAGLGDLVMKFVRVADERVVKNRWHWDVTTEDVAVLVDAGATVVRAHDDGIRWTVLADPQGNEFCAFAP